MDSERVVSFLSREWLLVLYSLLFAFLFALFTPSWNELISYIDWRTVFAIFGFLLVVKALDDSGFLRFIAGRIAEHSGNERSFVLFVVLGTAILAMLVTNDLALFTFVPVVLAAPVRSDTKFRTLVLLALAANVGAFLSPIGNPQKFLLWQLSGLSFVDFTLPFLRPFVLLFVGLLAYAVLLVPHKPIRVDSQPVRIHRHAAMRDAFLFVSYIVLLAVGLWQLAVSLVLLYFALTYRRVFLHVDWAFISLLLFLFADFGMLSAHLHISRYVAPAILSSDRGVFALSFGLTQVLSDVPTAVLLSHYTDRYIPLAMGTTVGAMGLIVASVANIIAVRFSGSRRKYLKFHIYSIPFALFSFVVVWLLL